MKAIERLMKVACKVEPGEVGATLLSFAFVFSLMASYYILRPLRDAMSSDWSDAELSTLFTGTFLFSVFAVLVYGLACAKVPFRRLVPGVYAFFALTFFLFYWLLRSPEHSTAFDRLFYIWVSVFSLFHVSVFWSTMAEIFSTEQAPRLFGFIASGASVGAVAGPALAVSLVGVLGTANLLLISALILLAPIVIVGMLLPSTSLQAGFNADIARRSTESIGGNPFAGFTLFIFNPFLLGIGLFILLYTAISTFVYFELKNLLAGVDTAMRVRIWGGMDLAVNVLAIGTAMFGTARLATRFGMATTLAVVPVVIVAGLLVVAAAPMIWVVVGLQIVRRAGNYAITRPGREMLFTTVDRETRFKAKSVIDIIVYRGGDMLTAWVFTGLTQGLGLGLAAVATIGAAIAAVWALLGAGLGRVYARGRNRVTPSAKQA